MTQENLDVSDWWQTEIIDMAPGQIRLRGTPIEDLIGNISFAQMIWLMTRGDLPSKPRAAPLEAALVSAVDHGPQAPSIAAARMAVTCGLGLNGAMASAVNMLDDVHGGAGEQAVALYIRIDDAVRGGRDLHSAAAEQIQRWQEEHSTYIPGFGHRFHKPTDPRAPRLLGLVDNAATAGVVSGRFANIGRAMQECLNTQKGKPVPMNIDGATAVIYAELGCSAPLARGLFCLSRSVGIIAHAWEQINQGGPNTPRLSVDIYGGQPNIIVTRWTHHIGETINQRNRTRLGKVQSETINRSYDSVAMFAPSPCDAVSQSIPSCVFGFFQTRGLRSGGYVRG